MIKKIKVNPIILSGGYGVRLWPLSRINASKQFVDLMKNKGSLFLDTLKRLEEEIFSPPVIVANDIHRFEILKILKTHKIKAEKLLLEPSQKNTAPACIYASYFLQRESILCILPADHFIQNKKIFSNTIFKAALLAKKGYLVSVGVGAKDANVNYGYITVKNKIIKNQYYEIEKFIEKPDLVKAKYLVKKNAFWNTGVTVVRNDVFIDLFKRFNPKVYNETINACQRHKKDREFIIPNISYWKKIKSISLDYALLEKNFNKLVIPLKTHWSDLGTYDSLYKIKKSFGNVLSLDTNNCFTYSDDKLLVTAGIKDLVIVNTKNATLVTSKNSKDYLRKIVNKLLLNKKNEAFNHPEESRPWGSFENIKVEPGYKVKKLVVLPGEKISLQKHLRRSEHWVVVRGKAKITKGKKIINLRENQSTFIKKGEIHRIENVTKKELVLIEVQTGSYLEEDDIIRIEDKYKR